LELPCFFWRRGIVLAPPGGIDSWVQLCGLWPRSILFLLYERRVTLRLPQNIRLLPHCFLVSRCVTTRIGKDAYWNMCVRLPLRGVGHSFLGCSDIAPHLYRLTWGSLHGWAVLVCNCALFTLNCLIS
jgi:hypothetical protein